MTANVVMSDTFSEQATKINELVVMTQDDGMSNFIKVLDTTNSTSNTSGSIITVGGVGIGKSVVVGENLKIHGVVNSTSNTTGSIITSGGVGIGKSVVVGENLKIHGAVNSTSNTTGSIITSGGVGIGKSVVVGENLNVHGNIHANGNITADGSLTFGDGATDNIVLNADVNSNIIPNTDNTFDLGSSTQKWKDLYVDGTAYVDAINLDGTAITASAAELNYNDITTLGTSEASKVVTADGSGNVTFVNGTNDIDIASHDGTNGLKLGGTLVTSSAAELNYNDIGTLGIAEVSKTVTSDASGNITFVNGSNDIDIASHDAGTNGLKLGGTLVTKSAVDINNLSTGDDATAVAVSMAIALG